MMCPSCQVPLSMSERQGIEVDYCPTCRGVWLDRGELDKIIERSLALEESATRAEPPRQPAVAPVRHDHDRDDRRYSSDRHSSDRHDGQKYRDDDYSRRRKKSFLSELLDF